MTEWVPTPLETASGLLFGHEPDSRGPASSERDALAALERAVRPALGRTPWLVSFSGGLDSSAVLAVAARVARREGLPPPVPVTLRFPGIPDADESDWQERLVSTLGLGDWQRIEIADELSVVGPYATDVLRRHGLLWPFNAYVHAPLVDLARGGALLTGVGGDEILARSDWDRLSGVLHGRARPRLRDARRVALALAPPALRKRALRGRCPLVLPWLRDEARASVDRLWAEQQASEPTRASARGSWRLRSRALRSALRSITAIAAERDVLACHPLSDPAVVAALARHSRAGSRGERLASALGTVLPDWLYARRSKASFDDAFWREDARALSTGWDQQGPESAYVEPDRLRNTWSEDVPDGRSYLLLQAYWLRLEASRAGAESSPRATPTNADVARRRPGGRPA